MARNQLSAAITNLFTRKSNRPDDPEKTAEALEAARRLLTDAQAALAEAEAQHEAGVPAAFAGGDDAVLQALTDAVDAARRQVEVASATYRAVEKRHQAAQEAADATKLAEAWRRAREIAAARAEAGRRLQAAIEEMARCCGEVHALDAELVEAVPVKPELPRSFGFGLRDLSLRWLAGAYAPLFGSFGRMHTQWEILHGPTLSEHIAADNENFLRFDPERASEAVAALEQEVAHA
jgi:hypothetical protein